MMKKLLFLILICSPWACRDNSANETVAHEKSENDNPAMGMHPDWTYRATIYKVNIQQHTPEGTINAFRKKLPELKSLGVKILWIMPIQTIGKEKRKDSLESFYSIRDYTSVNPDMGTLEDFKKFVTAAHDAGFKVILDWMDREDIADLNYDDTETRSVMLEAMKFWLLETDIDGFHYDMAKLAPIDFWKETRRELNELKPVFMLAKAEDPEYHEAFDMTYGWELHHIMNTIAAGEKTVAALDSYQVKIDTTFPKDAFRMYFTANYDENSWNGSIFERMPKDHKAMFVLAATLPHSIPLICSGQEYGLSTRLPLFEKDAINGSDTTLFQFYRQVIALKNTHPVLVNGVEQGSFKSIILRPDNNTYAYIRQKDDAEILVLLNFSGLPANMDLPDEILPKKWTDVIAEKQVQFSQSKTITLPPHNFLLLQSVQ